MLPLLFLLGPIGEGSHDKASRHLVCIASTAFWDATLKHDATVQQWLDQGGLSTLRGSSGKFEEKHPAVVTQSAFISTVAQAVP